MGLFPFGRLKRQARNADYQLKLLHTPNVYAALRLEGMLAQARGHCIYMRSKRHTVGLSDANRHDLRSYPSRTRLKVNSTRGEG